MEFFHHLQESFVVTHGSSAENNDGHPAGVNDGSEFICGSVGWKGSFDDVSPELRGGADGEADVLDRVVIGATNRKGEGLRGITGMSVSMLSETSSATSRVMSASFR